MPSIQGYKPVNGVTMSTISRIVSEQGFFSLWRGNNAVVYSMLGQILLRVTIFDRLKNYYMPLDSSRYTGLSYYGRIYFASGAALSLTAAFTYPYDLLYTRLAGDMTPKKSVRHYKTVFDCFNRTNIDEGFRAGLYKGVEVAMMAQVLRSFLMFPVYETLRNSPYLKADPSKLAFSPVENFKEKLGVSFVSAMLISMLVYPLDTIKRNI